MDNAFNEVALNQADRIERLDNVLKVGGPGGTAMGGAAAGARAGSTT